MDAEEPRYPDIYVQLTGEDSNTGSIMGRVIRALEEHAEYDEESNVYWLEGRNLNEVKAEFRSAIFFDAGSYDEVLRTVAEWVEVG